MEPRHDHQVPLSLEKKIRGGFGVALVILIISSLVSQRAILESGEVNQSVAQTIAVIVKLEALLSQLKDAETGQRGYLLTGERRYLEPYHAAIYAVDHDMQDLRVLIVDDLDQQRRITRLEPLLATKRAELEATIALRQNQGLEAALQLVRTDEGRHTMDAIRRVIEEMKNAANEELRRELAEAQATAWRTTLMIGIGDIVALLLIALAIFFMSRDIHEDEQIARALREIEQRRRVAEGLRDILAILNSNHPLDEILEAIVAQACRLLGTAAGVVYRLQRQADVLSVQAAYGLDAAMDIPLGWGAVSEAVVKRQPIALFNSSPAGSGEHRALPNPDLTAPPPPLAYQYGALLAVPLVVKQEVYGAIALYYHEPRTFSNEEIELAVALSDQAALAIENARLRTQAERMAAAAERSRLARDLHDAVTQTLFSTSLIADVLPRLWERDPAEGRRRLDELRQLTRGALAEMRTLLLELRPASLKEVVLNEVLRQLTEAITGRARVPVTLTIEGLCRPPPDVQIAFYRIAQEALNNIARHAGASQAHVRLRCRPEWIALHISDDGQGFDPTAVSSEHLGLRIMRERAEAIGAALRIDSQPGAGTQILLVWPAGADGGVAHPP